MSNSNKSLILGIMRQQGRADALDLRGRAKGMDGTSIIAEETKVPAFDPQKDYSKWPAGSPVADEGQIWTLLQPYNAAHYTGRPSGLRALWGLCHTKDPKRAKEWITPYGTSGLYAVDECCVDAGRVWRNTHANNEFAPSALPERWVDLGSIEEVQN